MPPKSPKKNSAKQTGTKSPKKVAAAAAKTAVTRQRREFWNEEKTGQLISFVEKNEALWVIDKKSYLSGKDIRSDLWDKIGKELKCSGKLFIIMFTSH